ncbi:MAG: hypothetical protein AVDCRST_MAG89-2034, partial [uncultured Gemmatimonadetes bacterium]
EGGRRRGLGLRDRCRARACTRPRQDPSARQVRRGGKRGAPGPLDDRWPALTHSRTHALCLAFPPGRAYLRQPVETDSHPQLRTLADALALVPEEGGPRGTLCRVPAGRVRDRLQGVGAADGVPHRRRAPAARHGTVRGHVRSGDRLAQRHAAGGKGLAAGAGRGPGVGHQGPAAGVL